MVRRNFIKAYNDLVNGAAGQGNVGGLNRSEFTASGPVHFSRDVDKSVTNFTKPRIPEKSYSHNRNDNLQQNHTVTANIQEKSALKTAQWEQLKVKDHNHFVNIDGEELFSPITRNTHKVPKPSDTFHKVQQHMSLIDLTKPFGIQKPNQFKDDERNESSLNRDDDNERSITDNDNRKTLRPLPKGFGNIDQRYVIPKFTPTFKDMISKRTKVDPLVSIMEPTPPSMQKWAVEWNSEPKNIISIRELQEDILKEKEKRADHTNSSMMTENQGEDAISEKDASNIDSYEGLQSSPRIDRIERIGVNTTPISKGPITISSSAFQIGKNSPEEITERSRQIGGVQINCLPGTLERPKYSKGKVNFSFQKTINNDDSQRQPENLSPTLKIHKYENMIVDEEKERFHQWFKNKLTSASENCMNESKSSASNTLKIREHLSDKNPNSNKKVPSPSEVSMQLSKPVQDSLNETLEETDEMTDKKLINSNHEEDVSGPKTAPIIHYNTEKNSSFFSWLKQRGFMYTKMKSTKQVKRKVASTGNDDKVVKKEPKFPWSKSYMSKYVPKTTDSKQDNLNTTKDQKETEHSVYKIPRRGSALTYKLSSKTSRKSMQPQTSKKFKSARKSNSVTSVRNQNKTLPYSRAVTSNELEYVDRVRNMDSKLSKYGQYFQNPMSRKPRFPSLEERAISPLSTWKTKVLKESSGYLEQTKGSPGKQGRVDKIPADGEDYQDSARIEVPKGKYFLEKQSKHRDNTSGFRNLFNNPVESSSGCQNGQGKNSEELFITGESREGISEHAASIKSPKVVESEKKINNRSTDPLTKKELEWSGIKITSDYRKLEPKTAKLNEKEKAMPKVENGLYEQLFANDSSELDQEWKATIGPKNVTFSFDSDLFFSLKKQSTSVGQNLRSLNL